MTSNESIFLGALNQRISEVVSAKLDAQLNELHDGRVFQQGFNSGLESRFVAIEKKVSALEGCTIAGGNSTNLRIDQITKKVDELSISPTNIDLEDLSKRVRDIVKDEFETLVTSVQFKLFINSVCHSAISLAIAEAESKFNDLDRRMICKVCEQYIESDEFRERIFGIVNSALDNATISIALKI